MFNKYVEINGEYIQKINIVSVKPSGLNINIETVSRNFYKVRFDNEKEQNKMLRELGVK